MSSSLKLWIPLTLVVGWALGHGTSRTMSSLSQAAAPSPQALAQLENRIEALSGHLASLSSQTRCPESTPTAGLDSTALDMKVRQALREELAASQGNTEPARAPESSTAREEVSPASLAALERGQQMLEDALQTRRWEDAQAEELRRLLPEMDSAQKLLLTQRLSASINRGEIVVETTDLPF